MIQLSLMSPAVAKTEETEYLPLGSIWDGDDAELLERMLAFYPRKRPRRILDATVNGGRFWRDSKRKIIGMDIAPLRWTPLSRPFFARNKLMSGGVFWVSFWGGD